MPRSLLRTMIATAAAAGLAYATVTGCGSSAAPRHVAAPPSATTSPGPPVTVRLTVGAGGLTAGPSEIHVTRGTQVTLVVASTQYVEQVLHVDGYNLEGELDAGDGPLHLTFRANLPGDFLIKRKDDNAPLSLLFVR